ncbi:hypothetical protein I3843_01G162300 [Carya illinoinensis]|nr:hypothetical protein I3760_01G167100 [Carya illinoinensis]KAG7996489.1 hypothetical protein I3843_01G162300 [Carya illinoinensis]
MEIKDSEDHLVGYMKSLTFFKYKNKERIRKEATKTDWTMHEYRLASDSQFQSWTLCRIRYRGHDHVQHGPRTDPSTSEQAFLDTRIPDFPSSEQAANFSNYQYRINYKHFRVRPGLIHHLIINKLFRELYQYRNKHFRIRAGVVILIHQGNKFLHKHMMKSIAFLISPQMSFKHSW